MATPVSYKLQNIDYIRLATVDLVTKPQAALSLFPENSEGTYFTINVSSTSISIRYISTSTTTNTYSYLNKTVEDLCQEINSSTLPIRAVPNIRDRILTSGDIYLENTSSYFRIPNDFKVSERLKDNGIIVRSKFYTVKHKSLSNFKLLAPYASSVFLPWNPVISNTNFIVHKNGRAYRYGVPEYDNQVWSIKYGKPFKDILGEELTLVRKNVYKVSRSPIYWNGESIKIYNNNVLIPSTIIDDVDATNGLIYFKDNTIIDEFSKIDYVFVENNYEYPYLNVNCHISQNPFLINKFVVFYAIPLEGIDFTINKRTIFHTIGDSVDEAIANIPYYPDYDPIIIGAYGCHQVIPGTTLSLLDTRVKGGGLIDSDGLKSPSMNVSNILEIEKDSVDVKDLFRESKFFYDIGTYDGEMYPGAGSIVVELPKQLKEKFDPKDIEAGVTKFMGAGILPVLSYYDRELPSISGISTQISLLMNGGLTENTYSYSGACWNRFPITLGYNPSIDNWTVEDDPLRNNVITIDGTGVIRNRPEYGTRQSYLKSTPDAGIEFYSRDVEVNHNSIQNTYSFSPWKKELLYDTRDVASGQLVKGWVYFEPQQHTKEYSRIRVNSPYRLDSTGLFKSNLSSDILASHKAISGNWEYLDELDLDINGEIETFSPLYVKTRISSMSEGTLSSFGDYLGASTNTNYLFDIADSPLWNSYSGIIDSFGKTLLQSFGTGSEIKFFNQSLNEFSYHNGTASGIDLTTFYNQAISYGSWRMNLYGTGDSIYNYIGSSILKVNSGHAFLLSNGYMPTAINYEYDTSISISSTPPLIPEFSGFSEAEVVEENNNDFDYLVNTRAILTSSKLIYDFSGSLASGLQPTLVTCWSGVAKAMRRADMAINGTRTNNGNEVVQHWYMPYNRYGKYAGSMSNQLIDATEALFHAQTGGTGLTYSNQTGIDVLAIQTAFDNISNILSYAASGFLETVTNGGLLDEYTPLLLKSYGWYVNNYSQYINHIQDYNSGYSPTDHRFMFSGVFHSGLYTYIKGMTTTNGDMLETSIVDGEPGPFQVYVPTKIFAALAEACQLDSNRYIPLTEAVYNTVKNNYSVNGYYYYDPLKILDAGTYEDKVLPYLVKLYNKL